MRSSRGGLASMSGCLLVPDGRPKGLAERAPTPDHIQEVASVLTWRSKRVRPQEGHETNSVLMLRMREPWYREGEHRCWCIRRPKAEGPLRPSDPDSDS